MAPDHDPTQITLTDEEKFKDYSDIDPPEHQLLPYLKPKPQRVLIISLLLLILITPIIYFTKHRTTTTTYNQCGTTAAEARSRGCVFETTGFAWLPPACADPSTEAEFLTYIAANDLLLYRDMNYTDIVSLEEVKRGEGPGFFVRQQYHLTHCLFLIKKLHRAIAQGRTLDGIIMPLHHTEHCIGQNLMPHGYRAMDVQLSYTKFPYCGRPGGYNVGWEKGKPLGWTDW